MEGWIDDLERGYDRVAATYTERIAGELAHKPFDRELLTRFVALVRPLGPACDLGCGPGHVARYLHDCGLEVLGIDLSSAMVAQARALNPDIPFRQSSMLALDLDDALLGGIVAFYSIIHVPRHLLPQAFAEMRRVLRPNGLLLLAFHLGEEDRHVDEWWDHPVSIDFYFFTRAEIEQHLHDAGFEIEESMEREPYPDVEVETRRAYILARVGKSGRLKEL
jgi:SAM-dependent methyltransferase